MGNTIAHGGRLAACLGVVSSTIQVRKVRRLIFGVPAPPKKNTNTTPPPLARAKPLSEQRRVLFPSNFGLLVLPSQGQGGGYE